MILKPLILRFHFCDPILKISSSSFPIESSFFKRHVDDKTRKNSEII